MPKVKRDTSHPDYGFIEEGDVSCAVGSPAVMEMPRSMARRKAGEAEAR